MASSAATDRPHQTAPKPGAERWIFVIVAALFFLTALAGFVPDSFTRLASIEAGDRPPFSIWAHFHAVVMGAWISLLLLQSFLIAQGRPHLHKSLGIASFVLIPLVFASFILIVSSRYDQIWAALENAEPAVRAKLMKAMIGTNNLLLSQLRAGMLFAVFATLALRARKRDSGFHKRMMILATFVVMNAAINRIPGLPSTMPISPLSLDLWGLLLLVPLFALDLINLRNLHRAFVVGFAIWLPVSALVYGLWGTDFWQSLAPRIMGYG